MRSFPTVFLFAAAIASQPLAAQVSVSLTALSPVVVTASDGVVTNQNTQPAGPLPQGLFSLDSTVAGGTITSFASETDVDSRSALCIAGIGCHVANGASNGASNVVELLATFTAATNTLVRFRVDFDGAIPAGATAPQALVDVGNDGTIDYANGVQLQFFGPQMLGPQPLQFRLVLDGALLQQGFLANDIRITVEPENDMQITTAAVGCLGIGIDVAPSFLNRGISVRRNVGSSSPRVYVFGLQTQPFLLPTVSVLPCLVLPRPDVVVVIPSFGDFALALPAAVRPATLWVQPVELQGGALYTGWAAQVVAN